jgi:RHH-type rel operon transcriptional repressor/antitoxin RelB
MLMVSRDRWPGEALVLFGSDGFKARAKALAMELDMGLESVPEPEAERPRPRPKPGMGSRSEKGVPTPWPHSRAPLSIGCGRKACRANPIVGGITFRPPASGLERCTHFLLYLYSYRKEVAMLAIRLPEEIETRLAALAKATGRTKTFYAREAIIRHIEDLEDAFLAEESYLRFKADGEKGIQLEEVERRLGLAD